MLRMNSIWMRLVVGLVATSLVAIAVASSVLYVRFETTRQAFREESLQSDAHLIARIVRHAGSDRSLQTTVDQLLHTQQSNGTYAITNAEGQILAASPGQTTAMWAIDEEKHQEFFIRTGNAEVPTLYGITVKSDYHGQPVFIQLGFTDPEIFYDSVLAEFLEDVAWVWIPFVGGLVLLNLLIVKRALLPLDRIVAQAGAIQPHNTEQLLSEAKLPHEVQTLVTSVNGAIRRMHTALQTQANFISDASHELRTPVSVLKAHASILPDTGDSAGIRDEVNALARLVDQLLDSARLDAIAEPTHEYTDICELAREVAQLLAPSAVLTGRKIEVLALPMPVFVHGRHDFLFRALRNVVENGLHHTPPRTSVQIIISNTGTVTVIDRGPGIPPEVRDRIFAKFWQGERDRSKGGAGLGMDIVRRTMEAMRGRIVIDDAPDGGASITLEFPHDVVMR